MAKNWDQRPLYEERRFHSERTPSTASSCSSSYSNKSENYFFANVSPDIDLNMFEETEPVTPTTFQKNLCLDATSDMNVELTDDEEQDSPKSRSTRLCLCAVTKSIPTQDAARPLPKTFEVSNFPFKTSPITDEYKITHEIIGIGESGKVMACFSKKDNTKYALKVLRDGPKSRREVQLHYLTNGHPNIVSIIDVFENSFDSVRCLLVVIEFLEAGDLLTQFENQESKPYSEARVADIIKQIGSAVQYLHSMNIAHRDIKLENILCTSFDHDQCEYKLADFGFAKRPERNHLMESPCCTPMYVAPEVLSHELYDKSCDMWSLGVVMYILLCGYPPFYSMKGLPLSPGMRTRITTGLYAFPRDDWDHVSEPTKNIIRNLLKTDPHARMSIDQLMSTSLITGHVEMETGAQSDGIASSDSGCDDSEPPSTPETPDALMEMMPVPVTKPRRTPFSAHAMSAQQMPKTAFFKAKPPRLHSIQEEVGRALEMMRSDTTCMVKSLKNSGSSLYERRSHRNLAPELKSLKIAKRA